MQAIKIKDFSEEDRIYVDIFEGTISSPKRAQSFSLPTTQQSGVSFSCSGISYYPQPMQITAQAYEGEFFVRVRFYKTPNSSSSSSNKIFGIESFSVDALFLDDIDNGDCNNNILTECSQLSGTILNPTLKQCVQSSDCKQKKFIYSIKSKTCVKNCSSYETQMNYTKPYCVENITPCDELKFGPCTSCDQGQVQCTQCYSDYELKSGYCVENSKSCSTSQFNDNSTGKCQECSKYLQNCSRCLSQKQCIECTDGYYISQTGTDGTSFTCQKCPDGCTSCEFVNKCSACNSPYQMQNGICKLSCASNQIEENGKCVNCPINCAICASSTTCSQCKPSFLLEQGSLCLSSCDPGYFQSGNICDTCSPNCIQCTSKTNCSQCSVGFDLINKICYQQCNPSQYRDSISLVCKNCFTTCLTCTSSSDCSLCQSPFLLQDSSKCLNVCETGYFKQDSKCLPCMSNCDQCTNSNDCQTCKAGFTFVSQTQSCLVSCMSTQYRSSIDPTKCESCSVAIPNCQNCSSSTSCSSCTNSTKLQEKVCVSSCSDGYFLKNNECVKCIDNCKLCSATSICSECQQDFEFLSQSSKCEPICPVGKFRDPLLVCQPCIVNCQTCSDFSKCSICQSGYQLDSGFLCKATCSDGQFLDGSTCQNCMSGCTKCNNLSDCITCTSAYDLISGICHSKCLSNQYRNSQNNNCENCPSSCLTCQSSTYCLTCKSGYMLDQKANQCVDNCLAGKYPSSDNSQCLSCSENCIDCISNSSCLNCKIGYIVDTNTSTCKISCYTSQYRINDNQCGDCPKGCFMCKNLTECTACNDGYDIQPNKLCKSKCNQGQFYNGTTCSSCPQNCIECKDASTCDKCLDSSFSFTNGQCQQTCLSTQFLNSITLKCENCQSNCEQCSSLSNCSQCIGGFQLYQSECVPNCLDNQYRQDKLCINCPEGCLTCTSNSLCQTCDTLYEIGTQLKICLKKCEIGQFRALPINMNCDQCSENCQICQSSGICTLCQSGFPLQDNQKCVTSCKQGTYNNNNICVNCPTGCLSCNSSKECLICQSSSEEIINGKCVLKCKSNEYRDQSQNGCDKCMEGCSSCQKKEVCNQCQDGFILTSLNTCISKCQTNEYFLGNECKKCPQYCESCLNADDCISCNPNYEIIGKQCFQICKSNEFRNSENKCISCMNGCLKCSSQLSCEECDEKNSYYKNSQQICNKYYCGDGIIQSSLNEECDDMNIDNSDGCNENCKLEQGFTCYYDDTQAKSICLKDDEESKQSQNGFKLKPTSPLSGDQMPVVTMYFSKALNEQDQNEESILKAISISIQDYTNESDYTVKVVVVSPTQVELHFEMKRSIKNKDIKVTLKDDNFVNRNNFANREETINQKGNFPDYVPVDTKTKEQTAALASVGSVVSTSIVSSIIPIILFSNFSILFNTLDLLQMISYLKYVNIRHPYNIIAFLEIFQAFQFPWSPNINDAIEGPGSGLDNNGQSLHLNGPTKFTLQEYDCLFLTNSGQDITQYLILIAIHLVLRFLSIQKVNPFTCLRNFIYKKVKNGWEWGWHLDCLWDVYLGLVASSFMAYYEIINNPQSNSLSIANYFLSIIFSIIVIMIPISFTYKICINQQNLENEEFKEKWGMLFEGIQIYNAMPTESEIFKKNSKSLSKQRNNFLKIIPINYGKQQTSEIFNEKISNQILEDENNTPQQTFNEKTLLKQDNFNKRIQNLNNSTNIPLNSLFRPISNNESQIQPSQINESQLVHQPTNTTLSKLSKDYFKMQTSTSSLSKFSKYYYCILYFRKLLFGLFIVFLHNAPLAQLLLLDGLNISIFLFIMNTKPYINNLENIKSAVCELFIIVAQMCLKILIKDGENQIEEDRLKIGWVFVSACCCILFIQLCFLIYSFITPLYIKIKEKCQKKKLNKVVPDSQSNMSQIVIKDCELSFNKLRLPQQKSNIQGEETIKSSGIGQIQSINFNQTLEKLNTSNLNQSQQMTYQYSQEISNENSTIYAHKIDVKGVNNNEINITSDVHQTQQQQEGTNNNLTFRQEKENLE